MPRANRTGQDRNFSNAAAVKLERRNEGFVETAILSLAGLAVSLVMLGQGIVADALQLMVAQ